MKRLLSENNCNYEKVTIVLGDANLIFCRTKVGRIISVG